MANKAGRISVLWHSANAYNEIYISGSAIGLLTIGVLRQSPKSLAVMQWVQSIWNIYYQRKQAIMDDTEEEREISAGEIDFSVCGEMPYSVPELMQEIFGG